MVNQRRFGLVVLALTWILGTDNAFAADDGALQPGRLRCEYLANPRGVDVMHPRLSWTVASTERGQRQTAFRILVASSPEKLQADQGDLWDTGQVESDETLHHAYQGSSPKSSQECFWKVRVWDRQGHPSVWSEPATWTMGLLDPADWQAEWIAADVAPIAPKPRSPHNGYHSQLADKADEEKWVGVDLGTVKKIDAVRLHPARPFDFRDTPGFLFPVRFKIEVASSADFSDAKTVVNQTKADVVNPSTTAPVYRFPATPGRYVRLTATRLAQRDPGMFGLALAEMDVLGQGKNLARGARVTHLDSIENGGWSASRLVDGRSMPDRGEDGVAPQPATMLRKEFSLPEKIKKATVYVTGLGLYELSINGRRVGDHLLAPEWTVYSKRLQYQTYDVTDLLNKGDNAIGAQLGEGWYAGLLMSRPALANPVFRLLMRLEIELADGTRRTVVSDGSWQGTTDGPIRASGIYVGETYDARKEMTGWDRSGFNAPKSWKPVKIVEAGAGRLVSQPNEPIRVLQERSPVKRTEPKPDVYIYDFGQNMVGWCRLKVRGPRGTMVKLRHGERLCPDGTLYTANLGRAKQTDCYTLRGGGEEVFEPHFTYHGFRYVEVTGLPEPLPEGALIGRVFRSASPEVGHFECSNPLLNKLNQLILWVQRGNMHGTPTDCPQRSERFGWMGDIQAFAQTAIFNMDMAAFFTKWVPDIRDSQADDGRFSDFSPTPLDPNKVSSGVPAWADAGTIVPWRVYQNYADQRMVAEHFESARRWVDYVHGKNPNLLWQNSRGYDFNDWLNGDTMNVPGLPKKGSAVPNEVFATCFFANSAEIVSKMAKVLGRDKEAETYGKLAKSIRKAFQKAYVKSDGRIPGDTQAGYALALRFNMVDESLRPVLMKHLLEAIRRFKGHPSTGIQTTHRLMLELTRCGQHDEAYRLATLETCPSWGYMIKMGATTIWERWDGYVAERGPQAYGMNSFNHWAFGSVGEWMWRDLAGINPDDAQPGFKHFSIRPRPVGDLRWVKARYNSIRGPIESAWRIADGRLTLRVVVPANTTATVWVPTHDASRVTEGGHPATEAPGVQRTPGTVPDVAVFEVESGRYEFITPW
ncbi:MAG: family 78 glycoside hydrolase catalytic domain [Pirellulales bacterium]|nr:family 78 glycoside hydrolase catalytic domain [Pirellulales bacterium]